MTPNINELEKAVRARREKARQILEEHPLPFLRTSADIGKLYKTFPEDCFKILIPHGMNINPAFMVAVQPVWLDTNTTFRSKADPNNRDFWQNDDGLLSLSTRAINKMAPAANVKIVSVRETEKVIDSKSGQIVAVAYEGYCETIDAMGNLRPGPGSYRYSYNDDLKSGKTPNQIAKRRTYAVQQSETGCINRGFFKCLGIDTTFSKDDLGKVVLLPYVQPVIDYNDPKIRQFLLERALGASTAVFGGGQAQLPAPPTPEPVSIDTAPEAPESPAPATQPDKPAGPSQEDNYRRRWENAKPEERIQKINALGEKLKLEKSLLIKAAGFEKDKQISWIMRMAKQAGDIPAERGRS